MSDIGVVITTVNGSKQYTKTLLEAFALTGDQIDVVVVYDGLPGDEVPLGDCVKYVSTGSRYSGYAKAVNTGVKALNGEKYVIVIHDDVGIPEDVDFSKFIRAFESDESIAVISPMLLHTRHTISDAFFSTMSYNGQHVIKSEFNNWYPEYPPANQQAYVDMVRSGFMVIRRSFFDEVGGFDEGYWPCFFEDFDFCMKCRKVGGRILYMPSIKVYHNGGATLQVEHPEFNPQVAMQQGMDRFKEKWDNAEFIVWKEGAM